MKEVYVLYGRIYWCEDIVDNDGNYFQESPCLEVYDNFDDAKAKLKEYAIQAYNWLKECGAGWVVDDRFIEETTVEDLFSDYNFWSKEMWKAFKEEEVSPDNKAIIWEEDVKLDLCWTYSEAESPTEQMDLVEWQMHCNNVPLGETRPILAGLYIKKCVVNTR